jgi:hypothetical protein
MITYDALCGKASGISGVKMHILSADTIRRMSVVSVKESAYYYKGLPAPNGIQDARMGVRRHSYPLLPVSPIPPVNVSLPLPFRTPTSTMSSC